MMVAGVLRAAPSCVLFFAELGVLATRPCRPPHGERSSVAQAMPLWRPHQHLRVPVQGTDGDGGGGVRDIAAPAPPDPAAAEKTIPVAMLLCCTVPSCVPANREMHNRPSC